MELFHQAKEVRLRSHHDKYLLAACDEISVCQGRNGSLRSVKWTVEFIEDGNRLRLKSCYNKYLKASNVPFLLGMTGKKVVQTDSRSLDSSVEWEPIKEGFYVRLRTRNAKYLRANGGFPPWRNSVTHDIPVRFATQDWVLWKVEIVERRAGSPFPSSSRLPPCSSSNSTLSEVNRASTSARMSPILLKLQESSVPLTGSPSSRPRASVTGSPSSIPRVSVTGSASSRPRASGRTIYFTFADDNGNIDDAIAEQSFTFIETSVVELTQKLEEETGLNDIIVCCRHPWIRGKLCPLRLPLPPGNIARHVVVVSASSEDSRIFHISTVRCSPHSCLLAAVKDLQIAKFSDMQQGVLILSQGTEYMEIIMTNPNYYFAVIP
ncbi:uncharacterized protein LOC143859185 [Tasmannia lanceolata]|uniref:uncharacterized protein LOC143859185 n=1 Tax=Tasmannia lanceolata TaxID=3420 RepID=UPI0040647600